MSRYIRVLLAFIEKALKYNAVIFQAGKQNVQAEYICWSTWQDSRDVLDISGLSRSNKIIVIAVHWKNGI